MEDAAVAFTRLRDELLSRGTAFDFFQAVRLLERMHPERARLGGFGDPAEEVARFSVHRGIAFPASEIRSIMEGGGGPVKVNVNFMGLIGPNGLLPYHYTLLAMDRAQARDGAFADFLDIFHHRAISLFYRAWKKHNFVASEELGEGRVRDYLLDLIGVGPPSFRSDLPVEEDALIFHAGLLQGAQRSAVALQQLLESYFGVTVDVEQFVGGWHSLSRQDQCALGDEDCASVQLGLGAVVGDEIWDQQSRVRVRLGPMSRSQYDRFLPTGDAHESLRGLIRFFDGDQFEFEVQLVLAQDDVPGCVLGSDDGPPQPLGWATWIRSTTFARDADDTVLQL